MKKYSAALAVAHCLVEDTPCIRELLVYQVVPYIKAEVSLPYISCKALDPVVVVLMAYRPMKIMEYQSIVATKLQVLFCYILLARIRDLNPIYLPSM